MHALRIALVALCLFALPRAAHAFAPSLSSVQLIDRGTPATTYADNADVRLADTKLDFGGGDNLPNNFWPALVSLLIPGLGQILWQNQLVKGILMILVAVALNGAFFYVLGGTGVGLGFVWALVAAYDAWMGGTVIPNIAANDYGADEKREAERVVMRFAVARPIVAER